MSSQKSPWQGYIDDYLMYKFPGKCLSAAAIVGLDGRIWACSNNFREVKSEELQDILAKLEETNNDPSLVLGGKTYTVAKHKANDWIKATKDGGDGVTIKQINQALIIGIYEYPVTADDFCVRFVEAVGNYLLRQGY